MKQISSFMSEISDEFKIVVVQAIRSLCLKFPRKHGVMMNFLASMLRDEVNITFSSISKSYLRKINQGKTLIFNFSPYQLQKYTLKIK